ncbi:SH2 domain-containing protein 7 [Brachyistius frenatus]|uniref:SH2 domain-containing protein 7 n=1 Tax=Brachyistius frenatus TaxID=100188 RepID=UPI0037E84D94
MEKKPAAEPPPEGGLKELVLRWFTDTQASLILHNGNFPGWFQGLAARKDAEDLLRDKPLGCFLIRLSDKAIGYILSYKGLDRCRHFVITQNRDGQFVVSGDCQAYSSLAELIEHYKVSPIQPFGEHLTSSCYEVDAGELYDVVSYDTKGKCGVSVMALRDLWDQKNHRHGNAGDNQRIQPPALPLKTKSRKLTGTVSLSQGVPPVPKRGLPLGFSLSGLLPDTTLRPSETQTDSDRAEKLPGNTNTTPTSDGDAFHSTDANYHGDLGPPGVVYAERRRSLPQLDNNSTEQEEEEEEEEEEYSNQLSSPTFTPSAPLPKVTCQTYSLHAPREGSRPSSSGSERQSEDLEVSRANPLYQTSERSGGGSARQADGTYAEVPQRPDDTYEQIPGEAAAAQGNMYESLEDMKIKKSKSTWGKNNMIWKKFLPDYKKK